MEYRCKRREELEDEIRLAKEKIHNLQKLRLTQIESVTLYNKETGEKIGEFDMGQGQVYGNLEEEDGQLKNYDELLLKYREKVEK